VTSDGTKDRTTSRANDGRLALALAGAGLSYADRSCAFFMESTCQRSPHARGGKRSAGAAAGAAEPAGGPDATAVVVVVRCRRPLGIGLRVPLGSRFLPLGYRIWPVLVAGVAVACLLQWGLARATGIAVAIPMLRYPSGRAAGRAMIIVAVAALGAQVLLIDRGLLLVAIVVAALAVVAQARANQRLPSILDVLTDVVLIDIPKGIFQFIGQARNRT
jgi:hypothetical protein